MSKKASSFLVSLLYLLLGIVFLIYKDSIFSTMKFVIGIVLLIVGAIRIISVFVKNKDSKKLSLIGDFIIGLIIAVVGILLLLPIFDSVFKYAFGLFFIVDGVGKLIEAVSHANVKNKGWWVALVVALLIIVAGVLVIVLWNTVVSYIAIIVGIMLIISGIQGFIAILSGKK